MAWELVSEEKTNTSWWYVGSAQECTVEFTLPPEQLPGTEWIAGKILDAIKKGVAEEGKLLKVELYFDAASWYDSKWLAVITAHGSPIAWALIVPAIWKWLAVLAAVVVLIYFIKSTKDKNWFGPGVILIGVGIATLGIATLIATTKPRKLLKRVLK